MVKFEEEISRLIGQWTDYNQQMVLFFFVAVFMHFVCKWGQGEGLKCQKLPFRSIRIELSKVAEIQFS